jgi:hypothetical protein
VSIVSHIQALEKIRKGVFAMVTSKMKAIAFIRRETVEARLQIDVLKSLILKCFKMKNGGRPNETAIPRSVQKAVASTGLPGLGFCFSKL